MATNSRQFYEVWEDTATVRDLVRALVITVGLTMGGYLLAPDEAPAPLIAGLSGAVLGFIICSVITPTKRTLETREIDEEGAEGARAEVAQAGEAQGEVQADGTQVDGGRG